MSSVLYGTVTAQNGQQYRGQLRWDDEEALWHNFFRGYRTEFTLTERNSSVAAAHRRKQRGITGASFGFMELWKDKTDDAELHFECAFGYLVRIVNHRADNYAMVTLKGGRQIQLKGGRGDLGDDIVIYDQKTASRVELPFGDIARIDFSPTPPGLISVPGQAVFGEVLTTAGTFTGYISWDLEECLTQDIISGRREGTRVDIAFGNIRTLIAEGEGSQITLTNGRSLFLNDHDDVDRGNHGIRIFLRGSIAVQLPWEGFVSLNLRSPSFALPRYEDYGTPHALKGRITLADGSMLTGQFVYDLEESLDCEILNGVNGNATYYLPFASVAAVVPRNDRFATVRLRSERELLLGGNPDVNGTNNGILIEATWRNGQFVQWKDIQRVDFE